MPALNPGARLWRALISRGLSRRCSQRGDEILKRFNRLQIAPQPDDRTRVVWLSGARIDKLRETLFFLKPDNEMKAHGHSESVST